MRFNDLFVTVLSGRAESAWSRAVLWRQCLDLLAQYGGRMGVAPPELDRVADTLASLRGEVPTERKLAAIRDLGGRLASARLTRLLLAEEAPVVAAAMRIARLDDREWPEVIAEAGPLARSVLRQRTDLGPEARRALRAFGVNDLSLIDLNAHSREAPAPVPNRTRDSGQIRRIVDRIERFNSERQERVQRDAVPPPVTDHNADGAFSFVTDAEGIVRSAQGQPAPLVVGLRLATPSLDRSVGPDGQILGAFRRRGAFRDGRLTLGEGVLAGCWLVDGDPLFDHRSGRFTGYRCHARRAGELDLAPYTSPEGEQEGQSASLRQLIHELRTPLSGVMGFAELIEAQLLGPVDEGYRDMAGEIVGDVNQLVDILDDLDLANRGDRLRAPSAGEGTDAGRLLRDAVERIGTDEAGHPRITLDPMETLSPVDVTAAIAERMIAHFTRSLAGCAGGETLNGCARMDGGHIVIAIQRPAAMTGLSDVQLFDSGFEHVAVNMDAPVLGVGFALRLVQRLAQANGGSFVVHADHFALTLPVVADAETREASS